MDDSCPIGTLFYVCQLNGFRGCCSVDPCSTTDSCPDTQAPSALRTATQPIETSGNISPQRTSTQIVAPDQPLPTTTSLNSAATSVSTASTQEGSTRDSPRPRYDLAIGVGVGIASFVVLALVCGYLFWKKYTHGVARRLDDIDCQNIIPGSVTNFLRPNIPLTSAETTALIEQGYVEMSSSPKVPNSHRVSAAELPALQSCDVPTNQATQSAETCKGTCSDRAHRATLATIGRHCKHEEFVTSWNRL
ncbi:hypothetical protein F4824DRAFT_504270 [Ustulina deusta]|nr:hypothetical protein F4824DRAFT_504270 [Ustulina deusta]